MKENTYWNSKDIFIALYVFIFIFFIVLEILRGKKNKMQFINNYFKFFISSIIIINTKVLSLAFLLTHFEL